METIKPGGTSMVAPRKYPEELRERSIRMTLDARQDPASRPSACRRIGEQLGINPETLRGWVTQAGHDDGGGRPARRARAGGSRAAPSKRDPAVGIGFLRGGARPPLPLIVDYIEEHRDAFGVEPICTVLSSADVTIAPSTYYAARSRPPSARAVRDEEVTAEISRVHEENYGVSGVRKVHAQLGRDGGVHARPVARCTVQRLMKAAGLRGISRTNGPRTTLAGAGPDSRPDLVKRDFTATAQDRLWVADLTYVRTFAGWVYCAFILDVFSRRVVGWQASTSLRTDLALDALEMGLWTRRRDGHNVSSLVHHSDRGVQYLAVRYTERLAEAGAVASVGSRGDSYDNAMAEAFNSLFKAELVRNKGPWRSIDDLEIGVAEYIDWFNHRRLHGEVGLVPPVEFEAQHHHTTPAQHPASREIPVSIKPGT